MNATPPISQTPPNLIQAAAPAQSDPTDRSNSRDFAGAMSVAGAKPARKPAAKQHEAASGGSALPIAGNQPPPNTAAMASAPPAGQAAAAASANSAGGGAVTAPAAGSPAASSPAAGSQAAGSPDAGSQAAPTDAPSPAPAADAQIANPPITSAAAAELAAAASPTAVDLRNLPPTPGGIAAGAPTMPHATSIQTPPAVAPAQAAPPAAAPGVAATPVSAAASAATKVTDSGSSKAEIAAATSAPISTSSDATQNAQPQASVPGAAEAGAAAQAAMAAALAQSTSAPSTDSLDTGAPLQGVAAAAEAAAPVPAGLAIHAPSPAAATSASVTAATAAAVVQAVSATADSGPTDKHSHDNTPDGSIGAAQLLTSNAASDTATGPTPTFRVPAGVDTAEFGQSVADRVSLMMDGNLTSAKLQVNPPALGPIEVRIALQGGHAQIWMSSHSAVTRDALESTSPKLREMLGAQGFAQVSVDISQRSFQDRMPQPKGYESVSAIGSGSAAPVHQASPATARSASALLDAYA